MAALLPPEPASSAVGSPIDNEEQRVTGRGLRVGADQQFPDISSRFAVWQDFRGTSARYSGNAIWSKNLTTRGESPVTRLSTDRSPPRISGSLAVWADRPGGANDDIYARNLSTGKLMRITRNAATQLNPAIDGRTVVWEDKRNGDNIDIYKKVLGRTGEVPVVTAPGDQTLPSVSGNTIAWRDGRRGLTTADVYVKIGAAAPVEVVQASGAARSISAFQAAVSGTHLLWNELDTSACGSDCQPKILKTCELPACATTYTVDDVLAGPPGSMISDIDISGSQATWVRHTTNAHAFTANVATCPSCETPVVVDTASGETDVSGARIDGHFFAWAQVGPFPDPREGFDAFWRNYPTGVPQRLNSVGLGPFVGHSRPSADGNFVAYEGPAIWATELSPRKHFEVSTNLSTGFSAPAIAGTRVAWSDNSRCVALTTCNDQDTYDREVSPLGSLNAITADGSGNPPDADGSNTAWRCDAAKVCVNNGTSTSAYDVSGVLLDPSSVVGDTVKISGNLVAWHEFFEGGGPDAAVHVLDTTGGPPGADNVVGSGQDVAGEFPDLDISGTDVVWAGTQDPDGSTIWHNTATGTPGSAVSFEAPVNGHVLSSVSIDGTRVAWIDCPTLSDDGCDVYTRDVGDPFSHLVTNQRKTRVQSPFVDGNRIYWTDEQNPGSSNFCCSGGDIFVEDATGAALPAPDTAAPSSPTGFAAGPNGGSVALSWTNPPDVDFFRVRILRRTGTTAPTSPDDPKATIVFEDDGTAFVDNDVRSGATYTYKIFAFDLEPNFSTPVVARTT